MRTAGRAHIQSFMWYFVHHPDPLSNRRTVITHEISRAFLAKVVYLRMNQHGAPAEEQAAASQLAHSRTSPHTTQCVVFAQRRYATALERTVSRAP
jgi:hypothetical protein